MRAVLVAPTKDIAWPSSLGAIFSSIYDFEQGRWVVLAASSFGFEI